MARFAAVILTTLLLFAHPSLGQANVIAHSVTDFSGVQGQGGWSYGLFNQTQMGLPYTASAFVPFDLFDAANNRWHASSGLVGAQNTLFLNLNPSGGHPNGLEPAPQDAILWAVRRYTSPVAGVIDLVFDVGKQNVVNPNGGGITAHIFVEGTEVFRQVIANADGVGVQGVLTIPVSFGTRIDLAIDPTGVASPSDGPFSARADGSRFEASVVFPSQVVPEPATSLLMIAGLAFLTRGAWRRRR